MSDAIYWPPVIIGPCRLCGWRTLTTQGLCLDCETIREESRRNRAFCALLHRDAPGRTVEVVR